MKRITFAIMFLIFLTVIGVVDSFAEEGITIAPAAPVIEPDMQWIWGEVVTVDPQNNKLTIKYLDYETDQEKELTVVVDEKTTFENVKSVAEIKPQDTLSLDYMMEDSNNVAKNISVEKPEANIDSQAITTIPEDVQQPLEAAGNVAQ